MTGPHDRDDQEHAAAFADLFLDMLRARDAGRPPTYPTPENTLPWFPAPEPDVGHTPLGGFNGEPAYGTTCPECAAVIGDPTRHAAWHAALTRWIDPLTVKPEMPVTE